MKQKNRRPVSVEDLLRLKRTERPAAESWIDFDRQLRAKQLAALLEKQPWWQGLMPFRAFSGFRRYYLPLGTTAVVAITFVSIRLNQPVAPLAIAPEGRLSAIPVSVAPIAPTLGGIAAGVANAPLETSTAVVSAAAEGLGSASVDSTKGVLTSFIPMLGVPSDEPAAASFSRSVESGLVLTPVGEPLFTRTLAGTASRFEARAMSVRSAVEPLHQITPPSERRGTRILTAMVSMAAVENAMRTTERAASRLSEEQLYDQIHRFGAHGAGVNVKF